MSEFKYSYLQLFNDAGTLIMTRTGTTNAYDGSKATTTSDMSPTIKEFYDTTLLKNSRIERYYAQFGMRQRLPAGHGSTVEWRKPRRFKVADKLQEGVIPSAQTFGLTRLVGAVEQLGTFAAISDLLEMQAYDPIITMTTEEMGASKSETEETLIRDGLMVGTNVLYCDKSDGTTVTSRSGLDTTCEVTPTMVNKAATILKKFRAPRINGKYIAVIHPSAAYGLRESSAWVEAHKYAATTELFNGEIGEIHGVRFIEDPFAPVLAQSSTSGAKMVYATFFFGQDAFGIIDTEGGAGAANLIIKPKEEIGGPLEQYSTVGYKMLSNGATILYTERMIRMESMSAAWSGVDDPTYTDYYGFASNGLQHNGIEAESIVNGDVQ